MDKLSQLSQLLFYKGLNLRNILTGVTQTHTHTRTLQTNSSIRHGRKGRENISIIEYFHFIRAEKVPENPSENS